jgi:signal transduction histidine kinase
MTAAAVPTGRPGTLSLATVHASVVGALTVSSLLMVRESLGEPVTSHAESSAVASAAFATVGIATGGVSALATASRGGRPSAWPLLVLSTAWLAPAWIGWDGGPAPVRLLGAVLAPLLLPALLHLALTLGREGERSGGRVIATAYVATAGLSLGVALTRDPFLDPACWADCLAATQVVPADPAVGRVIGRIGAVTAAALGTSVVGVGLDRLTRGSRLGRLHPALCLGLAVAGALVAVDNASTAGPGVPWFAAAYFGQAAVLLLLAAGSGVLMMRRMHQSQLLARLAGHLDRAPRPGALREFLADCLGDPGLEVYFWLPGEVRWVTSEGQAADPDNWSATRPRAPSSVLLQRGGEAVAMIRYDRSRFPSSELAEALGPAALVAVENERLRAELLATMREVRESRRRLVEAADAARRTLERDLHDGAQQRLLAVSYSLRLAADALGSDDAGRAEVQVCIAEVKAALAELRGIAHGIFPAVLEEAGLREALEMVTDTALLPVHLRSVPDRRLPSAVERAVYLLVARVVDEAQVADGQLDVSVTEEAGDVVVTIDPARGEGHRDVADRIGALGGEVGVCGPGLVARVPCG